MLRPRVQFYSWSGHGNTGDDWIADVASQYFMEPILVREQRSLSPRDLGRYILKKGDGSRVIDGDLLLWGGGWLAADRPASRTLAAWSRHLEKSKLKFVGMGLGIGPFTGLNSKQESQLARIFSSLNGKLAVRTFGDLSFVPAGCDAIVGCDIALLDERLNVDAYSGSRSDYDIVSFPSYSPHWLNLRPWLTEEWYRSQVEELVRRSQNQRSTIFVEFDDGRGGRSDGDYWSYLGCKTIRPPSVRAATEIFRNTRNVYAGRLHASILGAVVGAPTLALAYHHKFEVVEELGVSTFGLATEPMCLADPVRADPFAICAVRERGRNALSKVMANG